MGEVGCAGRNAPAGQDEPAGALRPVLMLASASPRRSALLQQVGADFCVKPADVDESAGPPLPPAEFAMRAALAKARAALAADAQSADRRGFGQPMAYIGADTVVVAPDGEIMGKPVDDADAARMLGKLEGRWHEVVTGVAVIMAPGSDGVSGASGTPGTFGSGGTPDDAAAVPLKGKLESVASESTRVLMRRMDADAICRYVATGDCHGKAGSYAIQGLGALLVERIDGCYNNVVGLPLARLSALLAGFGVRLNARVF